MNLHPDELAGLLEEVIRSQTREELSGTSQTLRRLEPHLLTELPGASSQEKWVAAFGRLDDEVLIEAVQKDFFRTEVFEECPYRRYHGWLKHWLQGKLRSVDRAEDLVQMLYVKLFDVLRAGKFVPTGTFKAWLFQVAGRLMVDQLRREKRSPELRGELPTAETHMDPYEELCAQELEKHMDAWIEDLPEPQRSMMRLSAEGKKSAEIAEALSEPIKAVYREMHNARERLRALLRSSPIL